MTEDFQTLLKETGEEGFIESVLESVFYVSGLPRVKLHELILTEEGQTGIVQALLGNLIEVTLLSGGQLRHKMRVVRTNKTFLMPVSSDYLGRVISPTGLPLDGKGDIGTDKYYPIDPKAPGVTLRSRVSDPLETGVVAVDMQVPLGRGQRQMVMGDQKTGKTTFCLQVIASQARLGSICIYASIGKKRSDLQFVEKTLTDLGVFSNVVIVAANAADPSTLVYLTPFSALSIAEYFRDLGRNVLVVFDDLTTHARFYREAALLSRRTPGRQSYPGDIFHIHARLVERAGKIVMENGVSVAITLLAIGETLEGDLAGYIQTNLMAMTDGHIFFDASEVKRGRHPAINFTLSVSRVGNQTKTVLERELTNLIMEKLATYRKAEEVSRFGVELTTQTLQSLQEGEKLLALFDQESQMIIPKQLQLIYLGLLLSGLWSQKDSKQLRVEKVKLLGEYFQGRFGNLPLLAQKATSIKELVGHIKNFFKFGEDSERTNYV